MTTEKKSRSALYHHRKGKLESSARGIGLQERRLRVVELRKAGKTEQTIAGELGISIRTLQRDLKAAMQGIAAKTTATAAELVQQEVQKLNEAEAGIHKRVLGGDDAAIDRLCKIVDLRSRLTGLQRESVQSTLVNIATEHPGLQVSFRTPDGNVYQELPHDPPPPSSGWQDPPAQRFTALPPYHNGPTIDSREEGLIKPLAQEPSATKPAAEPTTPEPMRVKDLPRVTSKARRAALQERAEIEGWTADQNPRGSAFGPYNPNKKWRKGHWMD